MLLMACRQTSFFIVLFFISQLSRDDASQQCGAGGELCSFYQMMLKGHTYKSFKTATGTPECREACLADVICQSYNVVMFIAICELNNRTKEARPEDFVTNKDRYYMVKGPKRVPLGSIRELPAESCKEIKASKGGKVVSGEIYWMDSTRSGNPILARCDMKTEVADYCVKHQCQNDAKCVNRETNYTCACNSSGWTGKYCEKDVNECVEGLHGCDPNANCDNTVGSYNCTCRPGLIGDGRNSCISTSHSCEEIRNASSHLKDGEYWIALKKSGSLLKVYCDMTTDGGGWLLVSNVVVGNLSLLQFSEESSYHEISKCHNKSLLLTTDAMKELRTQLSFTQLRFHCRKNKGRTFHLTTAGNSSGEAVVQYFSGQTDANPKVCGSFVRMNDDNSKIAADCNQWGDKQWGYPFKGKRRNLFVARVQGKYRWFLKGSSWECDDLINNDTEHFGLSTGDFWRVFVR